MFKRRKEIHKEILQPEQDNSTDISYRGQGLPNEYRLSLPSGLLGRSQATSFTRVFTPPKKEV
jgi:hypothetical protein